MKRPFAPCFVLVNESFGDLTGRRTRAVQVPLPLTYAYAPDSMVWQMEHMSDEYMYDND